MTGEPMPPEPLSAGDDVPAQGPEATGPPGVSLPGVSPPEAPPAEAERGTSLDPVAVTGPPWPRLVAAGGAYTPPRLIRWPIVVGVLLLAGWIAAVVAVRAAATSPSSASGYVLTASDAHFTATFPIRPRRSARSVGTGRIIAYTAVLPNSAVGVTFVSLPSAASFNLNGGINGAAASLPGGKVVSRHTLTYQGQPAEDAVITSSVGSAQVRVVRFGSSAYALEGFGPTAASFAHDYQVLLGTFTPHS